MCRGWRCLVHGQRLMQFRLVLSALAEHPFGTALLLAILVVVLISLAVAAYAIGPLVSEARQERRKQQWKKNSSVPVWIGRTSP